MKTSYRTTTAVYPCFSRSGIASRDPCQGVNPYPFIVRWDNVRLAADLRHHARGSRRHQRAGQGRAVL